MGGVAWAGAPVLALTKAQKDDNTVYLEKVGFWCKMPATAGVKCRGRGETD